MYEELKKWKELLDAGVITSEEYDMKKKQLLGMPAEAPSPKAAESEGYSNQQAEPVASSNAANQASSESTAPRASSSTDNPENKSGINKPIAIVVAIVALVALLVVGIVGFAACSKKAASPVGKWECEAVSNNGFGGFFDASSYFLEMEIMADGTVDYTLDFEDGKGAWTALKDREKDLEDLSLSEGKLIASQVISLDLPEGHMRGILFVNEDGEKEGLLLALSSDSDYMFYMVPA